MTGVFICFRLMMIFHAVFTLALVLLRVRFLILIFVLQRVHIFDGLAVTSPVFFPAQVLFFPSLSLASSSDSCFCSCHKLSCCLYNVAAIYRYRCYLVKDMGSLLLLLYMHRNTTGNEHFFFGLVEFIQSDVVFCLFVSFIKRLRERSDIWQKKHH